MAASASNKRNPHPIGTQITSCNCKPHFCFDVTTCPNTILELAPSCGCLWRHKVRDDGACPESKNACARGDEPYHGYCRGEWCYTCLPHRQKVGHCSWNCLPMDERRSKFLFPARIDLARHGHHDDFSFATNREFWHRTPMPGETAPSVPLTKL